MVFILKHVVVGEGSSRLGVFSGGLSFYLFHMFFAIGRGLGI